MSFKIIINDEEVVSNSNLQIKEEMLSTSSTILKNCYPKSWEEDKDYISRYYFPKDYSKCKITNETYYPEDPGITVKGTNLNINYDNSKSWELKGFFGDTLQDGTPTPSSPVPIQSVTGLQNINVCGKNLFDKDNIAENKIISRTTGKTSTNNSYAATDFIPIGENTTFTCTNFNVWYTACYDKSKNYIGYMENKNTMTTLPNTAYIRASILLEKLDIGMINLGSTALPYEPYKGNTYEVNLGKNLLDESNAESRTHNGITFTLNNDGSITANGTATSLAFMLVLSQAQSPLYKAGNYAFSLVNEMPNNCYVRFEFYDSNNTMILRKDITTNGTATLLQNCYLKVSYVIASGTVLNNFVNYIQIEKGTQVTSYSPYFTPIELNKIGDYQDSIKKSTGKNLFNKNNANKLDGYINSAGTITSEVANKTIYIPCKSSTTYTVSKIKSTRFGIASYSTTPQIGSTTSNFTRDNSATHLTLTTGSSDTYLAVWYYNSNTDTLTEQQILDSIMINEGSTALPYEPYGKVWYIHKEIGKVNLEDYEYNKYGASAGYNRNTTTQIPNIKYVSVNTELGKGLCEKYQIHTGSGMSGSDAKNHFAIDVSMFQVTIPNNDTPSGLFYYALATPTYTEITNEELISQLEAIYQSQLYNGINNISVNSENLSSSLEIHYNFNEEYTIEDLIFCGCIKNTGRISLNPREPHYCDLQILDFKTLLSEGDCLNYVISNKTISEAINQVVSSISNYGFVVGNIQLLNPDEIIGAYSTLNKTAYDVFQYFADITQSRWTTRMIDENTIAIDFYDPTLMPQGTQIQSTTEFYENNDIVDISFNYSTNDYRNKQIMTSDEVFANITQTQTIIADGYTKNFMCENKIGLITNITLNGVEQSFITKNEEQLGYSGDFIYQPGENTFISTNTISAGGIIVITYYPIVKGREIILNSNESGRIETQIGRKGIISRYENRNDSTSSQELQKIGQSYIKYKGKAEITLKIVSTKDIWNIGQIVNYNAPLEELTTDYMVKSKSIDMYLNAGKIFYTYELTSNFNYENAVNYFDNQRAKNQGNIGEGETITRNIDLESTALIKFYDTAIEEIQVQNPTSLDFALDGVLI